MIEKTTKSGAKEKFMSLHFVYAAYMFSSVKAIELSSP